MKRNKNLGLRTAISAAALLLTLAGMGASAATAQDDDVIRQRERQVYVLRAGEDGEPHRMRARAVGPLGFLKGGYLGVSVQQMTPELRRHFGVPEHVGVLVGSVEEDGAAAAAGIRVGDIMTMLDGEELKTQWDVVHAVRSHEKGETVPIEIWRDGQAQTLSVTLGGIDMSGLAQTIPEGVRGMLGWCEQGEEDCPRVYEFDAEHWGEAMERFRERLDSEDFRNRIFHYREHDDLLRERIRELEEKLEKLEQQLDELADQ